MSRKFFSDENLTLGVGLCSTVMALWHYQSFRQENPELKNQNFLEFISNLDFSSLDEREFAILWWFIAMAASLTWLRMQKLKSEKR
jgi:hypothetical protein